MSKYPSAATCRRAASVIARVLVLCLCASTAAAGTMEAISTLCHDRSRNGHEIRLVLEATGWQQAVVDPGGRYSDLAAALVLDITDTAAPLEERYAQIPALAGNFERMVLSGMARIYQKDDALLYWSTRPVPEGGEQVTCILGLPRDPETLILMERHGGSEHDPATRRLSRRVIEDDGAGRRSMRLWSRLMDEPSRTALPDLFYMERLMPAEEQ